MTAAAAVEAPVAGVLVALPSSYLACADCALPVPAGGAVVAVTAPKAAHANPAVRYPDRVIEFSRCPACTDRRALVAEVVAAHPALVGRLGPAGAPDRLGSALAALAALGEPLPSAETLTGSVSTVAGLIRHLASVGAGLRWSLLYDGAHAAATPWGHLDADQVAAARRVYVGMLSERRQAVEGAVWVAPPDAPDPALSGGCLLCGVGLVAAQPGDADAWTPLVISTPSVIAAPTSPDGVRGWVCAPCMSACQHVGAVGQAAMRRSLAEHLRESGDADGVARVQRLGESAWLVSWAGLVLRERRAGRSVPGPNAEPWGHVDWRA